MRILKTSRPRSLKTLAAIGLAFVVLSLSASEASAQFMRGRGGYGRGFSSRGYSFSRGTVGGYSRPRYYTRGYMGGFNSGPRVYSRGYGGVYRAPYARPYVAPRIYGGMGYRGFPY